MLTVNVPAASLVSGANAATFTVTPSGPGSGIYYDFVKLESD
jgi:hypothetical protein